MITVIGFIMLIIVDFIIKVARFINLIQFIKFIVEVIFSYKKEL